MVDVVQIWSVYQVTDGERESCRSDKMGHFCEWQEEVENEFQKPYLKRCYDDDDTGLFTQCSHDMI